MRISVELAHQKLTRSGCMVQLVFVKNGRVRMGLDQHVLPKNWDGRKQRVKFGVDMGEVINNAIEAAVRQARTIAAERPFITPKELRDAMRLPDSRTAFSMIALLDLEQTPPKSWFTVKARRSAINRFAEWAKNVDLAAIDPVLMERYYHYMRRHRASHNTAAAQLCQLRTVYRRCCRRVKMVPKDILDGIDTVGRFNAPPSRLDADEIRSLISYAESEKGWNAKAVHMWLFSFLSAGVRWGDLCCTRITELAEGRVKIMQRKSGGPKDVLLHSFAAHIATLYRKGDYIFGIAGDERPSDQRIASANVQANRALKKAAHACGIDKRIHTHNARHSFAAQAMDALLDDRAIQKAMGVTDRVYKHYKGLFKPDLVDEAVSIVLKDFGPLP